MRNKHSLLLLGFIILLAYISTAQVKTKTFAGGIPDNIIPAKKLAAREYKIFPLTEFDSLKFLANKNSSLLNRSRFALPTPVDIDILKEATLIKTGTTAIYYFTLKAVDASNISAYFNKFILSKNSLLSIYSKTELTDSVTAKENNETDTWSTRVYQGSTLHIVLNMPLEELGQSSLNLGFVYWGYRERGFTPHFGAPGASDPCQINVACPTGNGWGNERNSVALINANGHWATGTLVMNTCATNKPYLLTANHNLSAGNVQNWVFQFLYYSTDCSTDIGYREDIQINGCIVRASNGTSDFALLELNQTPPVNSGIHYAGWSRDSNPFSITSTTFLHHPAGDVLKISVDNGSPVQSPAGSIQCWRLALDLGGDQGGSSGGPYFNQQHRIVGQHYGVPTQHVNEPCHPEKYGGRFDLSWTGAGTNSTRLSNWLDPANTGAVVTNTTNIANLNAPAVNGRYLTISGNSVVCGSSQTYTINGVSPGATITWQLLRPTVGSGYQLPSQNVCSIVTNGNQATLTKINNGNVRLFATLTYCGGVIEYANKEVTFGVSSIANNGAYVSNISSSWYKTITSTVNFTNGTTTAISMAFPNNNQYTFTKNGGTSNSSITYWANGNVGVVFSPPVNSSSYISMNVQTNNACGSTNTPLVFYYNGTSYYSISPNPVNDVLSLSAGSSTNETELQDKGIKRIQIINKMGLVALERTNVSVGGRISINVSSLPPDVYTLIIYRGDGTEKHKFIVHR